MTTEEIIKQIETLVDGAGCSCTVAVQSADGEKIAVCVRGDQAEIAKCLMMLMCENLEDATLGVIAAYAMVLAKAPTGFKDPEKFHNYLQGCADAYFRHSGADPGSKKGLS